MENPNDRGTRPLILERLPAHVVDSMQQLKRWVADLPKGPGGYEYLIADLQSWRPGQTVRVAFLGGSPRLHRQIEEATQTITDHANLTLSFREGDTYRTWTEADTEYAGEIRVSFDEQGYFSLVGTDSCSSVIGSSPKESVGGRPHQRSLNLGGFDRDLPTNWKGTVRHEFLHALALHHEHQNMRGPCENAFRWDDDPDYEPTTDTSGVFVEDADNRRPGIYTYLSGSPNHWSREDVDFQLRTNYSDPRVASGPFDASSIMLYRFEPLYYKTDPSPCAAIGDGQELSEGDIRALRVLYPQQLMSIEAVNQRREAMLGTIRSESEGGFESVSRYELDAIKRLEMP